MSLLHNNKGIALVTALLFTLISLGIVMALLTIVTQGTRVSAANKTYKTAIEAGYGAVDVVVYDILPTVLKDSLNPTDYESYKLSLSTAINMALPQENCFNQKVRSSTSLWTACTAQASTFAPVQSPDITFNLKAPNASVGFNVYTKIIDTKCGGDTTAGQPCSNSDTAGIDYLDTGGGVSSSSGTVTPQHRPAYYRIEVQSERAANPREKAALSVLYAY